MTGSVDVNAVLIFIVAAFWLGWAVAMVSLCMAASEPPIRPEVSGDESSVFARADPLDETDGTAETPTSPNTTSPTPLHSTPPPTTDAAAVEELAALSLEQLPDSSDGFWEWIGRTRVAKGRSREKKKPKGLDGWYRDRRAEGFAIGELCDGYLRFLRKDDTWAASKDHATAVFIKDGVWPSRVRAA